jgi:hypothetical protein
MSDILLVESELRVSNASRLEELLRLQMQWLSPTHDLAEGKRILCQLVSHLLPSVRRFEVHRLGQGTSGAHVFRISFASLGPDGLPIERVLKLTPRTSRQAWKCQHELENYKEIEVDLGGDFRLVPQIHGVSAGESLLPAECGDWFAVLYTFFGGARLAAVDFEHAFIEPEACLSVQRNIRLRTPRRINAVGLPQSFLDTLSISLGIGTTGTPQSNVCDSGRRMNRSRSRPIVSGRERDSRSWSRSMRSTATGPL